jgi:NAD(P)-dependent dehydrogenase (short-subunit alcohol dehydrogenase family)
LSSYGGQVAFSGNSLYHATRFGIEGFCEPVAQEVTPFGIGVTIVEPGGARTEFRYGSAQVAAAMPEYVGNPARSFEKMLDPVNGLAVGDPVRMAAAIIDSVDQSPAPAADARDRRRWNRTISTLQKRIADFQAQHEVAASTDYPPGE